jgi:hypothetical protein
MIPDGVVAHAETANAEHRINAATDNPTFRVFTPQHPFTAGIEMLNLFITVL